MIRHTKTYTITKVQSRYRCTHRRCLSIHVNSDKELSFHNLEKCGAGWQQSNRLDVINRSELNRNHPRKINTPSTIDSTPLNKFKPPVNCLFPVLLRRKTCEPRFPSSETYSTLEQCRHHTCPYCWTELIHTKTKVCV